MAFYRTRTTAGLLCNDTRNTDRGELELILEGHRLWALLKRGKSRPLHQQKALHEELEAVWEAKRLLRAELRVRRAEESARMGEAFRKLREGGSHGDATGE